MFYRYAKHSDILPGSSRVCSYLFQYDDSVISLAFPLTKFESVLDEKPRLIVSLKSN